MIHRSTNDSSSIRRNNPTSLSAVQTRNQAPNSSGDYAFVSSVLSYTHSAMLFSFTLPSSTADGSSTPESLFDDKPRDKFKTKTFSTALKKLYHGISLLKLRSLLIRANPMIEPYCHEGLPIDRNRRMEKVRWKKAIEDYKA